jgi:HSP20 family protein
MRMGELVPENRGQINQGHVPVRRDEIAVPRNEPSDPFSAFHREVTRFFDDAFRNLFRGFELAPFSFDRRTSWPKFRGFELHHEVRIFEGSLFGLDRNGSWPKIEVIERGGDVQVRVELPGFDETEIKVELADGALIIGGESRSEREDRNEPLPQRGYRKFERRIPLDWDIEEDKVAASFRNGLLSVTLPKPAPVQELTKRIPIDIR